MPAPCQTQEIKSALNSALAEFSYRATRLELDDALRNREMLDRLS